MQMFPALEQPHVSLPVFPQIFFVVFGKLGKVLLFFMRFKGNFLLSLLEVPETTRQCYNPAEFHVDLATACE